MYKEKIIPLIKGIIKNIPGIEILFHKKTGGTINSRYCYSVWLRHLIKANEAGLQNIPKTIAELGPGDSLGIGFAGLLSGSENYYALDIIKYWDSSKNVKIFNELVDLFMQRENIPDNNEFPEIKPELDDYSFPEKILSESRLKVSLTNDRINKIRNELTFLDENNTNKFIRCFIPWDNPEIINHNSIDFIYSQAVLEHVEDLEKTYQCMNKWLKPSGMASHTIDFKSHGATKSWNGHWTFSDFEWKIVKGRKKFYINRYPYSKHIEMHKKYNFKIINKNLYKKDSSLKRKYLAKRFRNLDQSEFNTSEMFIQSSLAIILDYT